MLKGFFNFETEIGSEAVVRIHATDKAALDKAKREIVFALQRVGLRNSGKFKPSEAIELHNQRKGQN